MPKFDVNLMHFYEKVIEIFTKIGSFIFTNWILENLILTKNVRADISYSVFNLNKFFKDLNFKIEALALY